MQESLGPGERAGAGAVGSCLMPSISKRLGVRSWEDMEVDLVEELVAPKKRKAPEALQRRLDGDSWPGGGPGADCQAAAAGTEGARDCRVLLGGNRKRAI